MEALIPLLVILFAVGGGIWMVRKRMKGRSAPRPEASPDTPAAEIPPAGGKTKQCRECKAEIPKSATKCMHCGAKQGVGCGGAIVAVVFVVIVVVWVIGSIDKDMNPPAPLTAEQKADKAAAAKLSREKSDASSLCMDAVRAAAKFPSSVDFSILSSPGASPMHGGGWIVRLAFESKNGLGLMIPSMARCEVKDGRLQHFSISNR